MKYLVYSGNTEEFGYRLIQSILQKWTTGNNFFETRLMMYTTHEGNLLILSTEEVEEVKWMDYGFYGT